MICNIIVDTIKCGQIGPEGCVVLCDEHHAQAERDYPQGWRYAPGDTCEHMVWHNPEHDCCCGPCEDAH